ncbi:ABC transporter substrate-binding protein [Thermodesulfobacteriota bacterium]
MKSRKSLFRWSIIVGLVVFGLLTTSGAVLAEKPVYHVGHITMLTGVYGPTMSGNNEGFMDAIDYVNEKWNLPVTIKGVWVDGASSPAKSLSAGKKMVSQYNPVILINDTTPTGLAMKKFYMKTKIPSLEGGGAGPMWALPSWSFSLMTPYQNQVGAWVDYYLKHLWPQKGLNRAPNFAWVTWDNAAGRASYTDKVKAYIRSKGVNIVHGDGEFIPGVPTEVGAQMMRLKKNKVDFTYGLLLGSTAVAVLKGAGKYGVIDQIDFHIITPSPDLVAKKGGDLARNVYAGLYTWTWEMMAEKAPDMVAMYKKKNRKVSTVMYPPGFSWGLTAAKAIQMAAEDVGPDKITGEACYNALKKMKNFDRGGVGCYYTFGEKKRYGCDTIILQRLNNSRINIVGEFPTPNLTGIEW